jgi:hypothetical protein
MFKRRAAALWTKQNEGVEEKGQQHSRKDSKSGSTSSSKRHLKRQRTLDEVKIWVNQRYRDGTQGAKQKVKTLPSMFENKLILIGC